MHIVGTDEITVEDKRTVPSGPQHAVDQGGRVLCRATRARFTWPGLAWTAAADSGASCPLCVQVHHSQQMFVHAGAEQAHPHVPVYPSVAVYPQPAAYPGVPAQPTAGAGDSVA